MRQELLKGLTPEAQEQRKKQLRAALPAINIIREALEAKLVELQNELIRAKNYDSPHWALKQADYIGAARQLQDVINLLTLDREN